MKIQEYDFEIIHRAGNRLAHVDAMSRAPVEPPEEAKPAGFVYITDLQPTDWVAAMQFNDERAREILNVLNGKNVSTHAEQLKREYKQKNQRLYKNEGGSLKLFVPKAIRYGIIKHFHDCMGHFALEKTINRIKQLFWFPKMRKLVKDYLKSCISCCFNKSKGSKPEGEMYSTIPEPIPFRLLHIDHLGPFIRSKKGNFYIITISDAFSKFCVLKPARNTKTTAVINTLTEVMSYFGLPTKIVSDRGTAFTSKMFEEFCEKHNIIHVKNAVRTPRANGQAERTNETILNALKCSTQDRKEWDNELPKIQWIINSQPNATTKYTPNELIFNFNVKDLVHNHLVAAVESDINTQTQVLSADQKRENVLENINAERAKWKDRFDKKHAKPTIYKVNDLVVLRNEPAATGESRKLEPKYRGPYLVKKVLGNDRYLITDVPGMQVTSRQFTSVFASELMKPWCQTYPELGDDNHYTDNSSDSEDDDVETTDGQE